MLRVERPAARDRVVHGVEGDPRQPGVAAIHDAALEVTDNLAAATAALRALPTAPDRLADAEEASSLVAEFPAAVSSVIGRLSKATSSGVSPSGQP